MTAQKPDTANQTTMQTDRQRVELLQLQYELAMAIGTSLEMRAMLRQALGAFLRKLNCSAGGVFIQRNGRFSDEPEYAIPRRYCEQDTVREPIASMIQIGNAQGIEHVTALMPQRTGDAIAGYHYLLAVPGVGFLSLLKHGAPLDSFVIKSLPPLLEKLSAACLACLQNEDLADANRRMQFEHNMLRTVIANTPIIVFSLDTDGLFTLSEGTGLQALGREAGQAVGHSIFYVYRDKPEIIDAVHAAMRGEATMLTVEVHGRYFDAYYEPLLDEHGEIAGVVGVALDITERRDVTEALSTVLNTVGEGILTIDSDGVIDMVNRELEKTFGYETEELLGANVQMLIPAQHRNTYQTWMESYRTTGDADNLGRRLELDGLHQDGHTFPLELNIQEAILRDRSHFIASLRDITQRKEYDRMRDDFVSTVSHELRTPLTSILGWSETLLSGRPGPLNEEQERFLQIVVDSSLRLQRLIEEILTISHVQNRALHLSKSILSPSNMLDEVQHIFAAQIESRQQKLVIENTWPDDEQVHGDGVRIEQVLSNLISNAIKFSPRQSTIWLRSSAKDQGWFVEVIDQGIGIPSDEVPRLFTRFYRATTAKEAQIQGTGLGLYISKAIIDGHDGVIELASKIEKGTTVSFWIPQS